MDIKIALKARRQLINLINDKSTIEDAIFYDQTSIAIITKKTKKLGKAVISKYFNEIKITDEVGLIERTWAYYEKVGSMYIFTDYDFNQWIVSDELLSWIRVSENEQMHFIRISSWN